MVEKEIDREKMMKQNEKRLPKVGKVWLIGAGPGDEGLLTVKGADVLKQAEVVVYDQLVGAGVLTQIPQTAEWIDAGKHAGNHKLEQQEINQILIERAREGKQVVRLKGGDPFLFGRGGEEALALSQAGILFEVIPGVSSAVAVPAYAGIPVTHRNYTPSVHIVSAHRKRGSEGEGIDYKALASLGDVTLIFFMGISALPKIAQGLIGAGVERERPSAVIERGTRWNQRLVTAPLGELAEKVKQAKIQTPGLIVVGRVCELAETLHWTENRLLGKERIWVVRPREKESKLAERLQFLGAEVIQLPSGKICPLDVTENKTILSTIQEIERKEYDWIGFTSEAGVRSFFQIFFEAGGDIRQLHNLKFASVGTATSRALREFGILADCESKERYGRDLGQELVRQSKEKERLLLCLPEGIHSECAEVLLQNNWKVKEIPVYCVKQEEVKWAGIEGMCPQRGDFAMFASASAVRVFAETFPKTSWEGMRAICIGEKTKSQAEHYGFFAICSDEVSIDSMVEKVLEITKDKRKGELHNANIRNVKL